MCPNSPNPVLSRHLIPSRTGDYERIIVVSDMVPDGRPIKFAAGETDGLAETLVSPRTFARMEAEGTVVEECG
jgi:hypothetical protein